MVGNRDRAVAVASLRSARLGTLLGVVLLAASPRPAQACTVVTVSELTGRTFWPRSGELLPTNGQVTVRYEGHWAESSAPLAALASELQLRPVGGQPIAVTTTVADGLLVVQPDMVLAPNQGYELLDQRPIPCTLMTVDCGGRGEWMVVASFTTTAGPDIAAPPFAGLATPVWSALDLCSSTGCCGPYRGFPVTLSWPATTDQGAPAIYRLYRRGNGGALERIATTEATSLQGFLACDRGSAGLYRIVLTPGAYLVRAVDNAGNEDSNTTEQVLLDRCTAPAAGVPRGVGGGCTVTPDIHGARGLLDGALILLALAALRPRRRFPRITEVAGVRARRRRAEGV